MQHEWGMPLSGSSADEVIRSVVRLVQKHGVSRESDGGLEVRELLGVSTVLTNPRARLFVSERHPEIFNPGLAVARFFYLISGSHELDAITFYSPAARRFSDDGLVMPGGSHGFRLFYPSPATDQVESLLRMLREHPERNRSAVAIYRPDDCGSPSVDLTCVMGALFTCKGGRFHTLVNMRANDALRLMWYDLFEFSMLSEYISAQCGFALGKYYHSSFVMMLIGRHALRAAENVVSEVARSPVMDQMPTVGPETRRHLIQRERALRSCVASIPFNEFRRLLDALAREEEPYWADLMVALALQGRYANTEPRTASCEADFLEIPNHMTVASQALENSVRILEMRVGGAPAEPRGAGC
jgi:thymidylate synthase